MCKFFVQEFLEFLQKNRHRGFGMPEDKQIVSMKATNQIQTLKIVLQKYNINGSSHPIAKRMGLDTSLISMHTLKIGHCFLHFDKCPLS